VCVCVRDGEREREWGEKLKLIFCFYFQGAHWYVCVSVGGKSDFVKRI